MDDSAIEKRKIIYVDAYFNREVGESKISLFDPEENQKNILTIIGPPSIAKAEQCAILYGCLYLKKLGLDERRAYILNDNQAAVKNSKIIDLCKKLNIGISWIPREINTIADEGTKLNDNIDSEEGNILLMFYHLIIGDDVKNKSIEIPNNNASKENKISNINERSILKKAIESSKKENKPYVAIGQIGKYLKAHYPNYKYTSLKKEFLKYDKDFIVVDNNFVKELV